MDKTFAFSQIFIFCKKAVKIILLIVFLIFLVIFPVYTNRYYVKERKHMNIFYILLYVKHFSGVIEVKLEELI